MAGLLLSAPAAAQDAGEPASVAEDQSIQQQGGIVVTARRRDERLADSPVAITAFSAEKLQDLGALEPANILGQVSGVFFRSNTTAGTAFINIRGVTQSRNAESPVAVVVDGVFLNNPLAFNNQLVDIAQIEVLKGPQGALYGRNASAGAIIITTNPPTDEYEGYLTTSIGRRMTYNAEAAFGGPIVEDKLAFRLTAYARGTDGFLRNQFLSQGDRDVFGDRQRDAGVRGRLLWTPSTDVSVDFRGAYTETQGGFNNAIFDPLNRSDPSVLDIIPFQPNAEGFNFRTTYDFSVKLDWETDIGTLTLIPAYNDLKERAGGDSLPYGPSPDDGTQWLINEYETKAVELRLTSNEDQALRYMVGAYYQQTDRFFGSSSGTDTGQGIIVIDRTGETTGPDSVNPASGGITGTSIDQEAWAVFGSLAYDIAERIELSAALRYDRNDETATNTAPFGPGFVPNPQLGNMRDISFDRLQPKITLRYQLDGGNIYVSYGEGLKTGGFNPEGARERALLTDPNTPIRDFFEAEVTKTIEVGLKKEFLGNRGLFSFAGFRNDIRGANFFDFFVASAAQLNLNIDKVEVWGLEADVTFKPIDSLTLGASFTYLDNEIKEYQFDPQAVGSTSPYFPDIASNVSVQWQDRLFGDFDGFFRADWQHVGRLYWDLREQVRRPPINFIDLRAGLVFGEADEAWRATLFCRNCTNENYVNEAVVLTQLEVSVLFPAIDTRVYGLELSKRF